MFGYPNENHAENSMSRRDLVLDDWPIGQPKEDWGYSHYGTLYVELKLQSHPTREILQLHREIKYFGVNSKVSFLGDKT